MRVRYVMSGSTYGGLGACGVKDTATDIAVVIWRKSEMFWILDMGLEIIYVYD